MAFEGRIRLISQKGDFPPRDQPLKTHVWPFRNSEKQSHTCVSQGITRIWYPRKQSLPLIMRVCVCVGGGGSRCPINSQSSVTFRNKHYYIIHDSFSQAAMCGKIRWMLSGEKTWGWLWLRKQWWIVTSWWNASIKRWFWRSAPNTHISDCRWIMFFIFVFFFFFFFRVGPTLECQRTELEWSLFACRFLFTNPQIRFAC